jgi:hypothetical protein
MEEHKQAIARAHVTHNKHVDFLAGEDRRVVAASGKAIDRLTGGAWQHKEAECAGREAGARAAVEAKARLMEGMQALMDDTELVFESERQKRVHHAKEHRRDRWSMTYICESGNTGSRYDCVCKQIGGGNWLIVPTAHRQENWGTAWPITTWSQEADNPTNAARNYGAVFS